MNVGFLYDSFYTSPFYLCFFVLFIRWHSREMKKPCTDQWILYNLLIYPLLLFAFVCLAHMLICQFLDLGIIAQDIWHSSNYTVLSAKPQINTFWNYLAIETIEQYTTVTYSVYGFFDKLKILPGETVRLCVLPHMKTAVFSQSDLTSSLYTAWIYSVRFESALCFIFTIGTETISRIMRVKTSLETKRNQMLKTALFFVVACAFSTYLFKGQSYIHRRIYIYGIELFRVFQLIFTIAYLYVIAHYSLNNTIKFERGQLKRLFVGNRKKERRQRDIPLRVNTDSTPICSRPLTSKTDSGDGSFARDKGTHITD